MKSIEEKFPVLFDKTDDLIQTGQLLSAASLSNQYDLKKGEVVLIALPETDGLWTDLIEECMAQKVHVIIPGNHRDAAFIARTIREEAVCVLAITPALWAGVYQMLNAHPANITRMQVIISDGKGGTETRFSLIPGTYSKVKTKNTFATYQLPIVLRGKAS